MEKLVVSNLTHATLLDGELYTYIFVKQQAVTLNCHLKMIQYVLEVCCRQIIHRKNRLKYDYNMQLVDLHAMEALDSG